MLIGIGAGRLPPPLHHAMHKHVVSENRPEASGSRVAFGLVPRTLEESHWTV